jgi:energy-coupling factor transporter ATP-binding protein EcfA2
MKLVNFSISNYRSITRAHRIPAGSWTVLIGPNNEGKSNILKGLATALAFISAQHRVYRPTVRGSVARTFRPYDRGLDYKWERDFPLRLQDLRPNSESVFTLELELTDDEVREFRTEVGSRLNGTLPIRVSFGRESVAFRVAKRGPGSETLTRKVASIAAFISKRLELEYIPAVRTAQSARRIVDEMVGRALRVLESNTEYRRALEEIAAIQSPALEAISANITASLQEFLPDVTEVRVSMTNEARYGALRASTEIVVDDGSATELQFKGDGVQSLAALSLMRYASERGALGRNLVLAIEEPESHLHPRAIHQLRRVLREIATDRQLVMTTHNPLFVDRMNVGNNIVVAGNRASPAASIREIRDTLGVRAADNLRNADLVVVCEGEDDAMIFRAILAASSDVLGGAVTEGVVAFDSLIGGGNLSYKLGQLRDSLCQVHVVLDDDAAGRAAAERAIAEGLLDRSELTLTCVAGSREAEIEDLIDVGLYRDAMRTRFAVDLSHGLFRSSRKWSERMALTFRGQGKLWSDTVKAEAKRIVAESVVAAPGGALQPTRRGPIDALIRDVLTRAVRLAHQ